MFRHQEQIFCIKKMRVLIHSDLLFRTGISFSVPGFDSGDNSLLFRNVRVASQILIKKFINRDLSKADVETVRTLLFVISYDECGVINNTLSNTKILFDEFQTELFIEQMKSYCLKQNQI